MLTPPPRLAVQVLPNHSADPVAFQAVSKLVLIDAQGFIDGIGPMGSLPRPLAAAGVALLRTEQLREAANQMAYHDKARFATQDARRVGRLHTFLPGAAAALLWYQQR